MCTLKYELPISSSAVDGLAEGGWGRLPDVTHGARDGEDDEEGNRVRPLDIMWKRS